MDECTSKTSKQSPEIKFKVHHVIFLFGLYIVLVIVICAALLLV